MKNRVIFLMERIRISIVNKVHATLAGIKEGILNLRISTKFILFYLILLIFSISLSNLLFQRISARILESKVGDVSVQTLNTISSSVDSLIGNINSYSKMILSNEYIQGTLSRRSENFDVEAARKVNVLLAGYMEAMPTISSICLFDNDGNKYAADRRAVKRLKYESLHQAKWYNEMVQKKGKYLITMNAGGVFEEGPEEKYVSFIRMINDLQFNKPIGVLMINIRIDALKSTYIKAASRNNVSIAVADESGEMIIDFEYSAFKTSDIINSIDKKKVESEILKIGRENFLVSSVRSEQIGWRFVSAMSFGGVMREYRQFDLIAFFIILLNSGFLFVGAVFISRIITTPIKKIIEAMKKTQKGELQEVFIRSGKDEIGELRDGYNIMVAEIRNMIGKMMIEQKIKRKAELNVLQEQIKPHFLYNSLDAIAYMTISGKGEDAYNIIIALSNYYRTSLSKGSEVITILDEVEIVRNYLTIQKVRYPNLFTDEYEIDEGIETVKILKLILQPLVENALYHGIRPKGENGRIKVKVKRKDKWIKLSVEDDGVGMNTEELNTVIGSRLHANASSFGLRGTIERLRIFYGIDDIYEICSTRGQGTTITIRIPID